MDDSNARVGNMQFQPIVQDEMDKNEAIKVDPLWYRSSADEMINLHGRALRCMMNGMHMPILNGMKLFPRTNEMTCYSANGGSCVVDYV